MTAFVVYRSASGEITRTGEAPKHIHSIQPNDDESVLSEVADDKAQYVDLSGDEPVIADKASMNPTVSTSTGQATITNLPDGTAVRVEGTEGEATDGSITIEVDEPGTYRIELSSRPQYLDHTLEVDIP